MPAPKFKPAPRPGTPEYRKCLVAVLDYLQEELPCEYPVRIRLVQLKTEYGYCDLKRPQKGKRHFLIVISQGMDFLMAKDTLLHEYAHALCWSSCPAGESHGPEWGVAFSRVYQAAVGDD